jgi:hypothetical protein
MDITKLRTLTEWQMCKQILDKEIRNISAEEWDDALTLFKTALDAGQRYLQREPNDVEVFRLVSGMQYPLEGLEDIEAYGPALLYCMHGLSALMSCKRGQQEMSALPPGDELSSIMKGAIIAILEEEAILGFQTALQMKPNYTCAQDNLQEAQALLAQLQGKPNAMAFAKMLITAMNPNHPIDHRIMQDLTAVMETGNHDLVELVISTSQAVDRLIGMQKQRQFQEGLSFAAMSILTITVTLERYPQARPYFLFNWGRLHIMSASLLYDQWLAAHPNPRGADGRKLEEALVELQVARQLTTYPSASVQHQQDLAQRIEKTLRETQKKGWLAGLLG